MTNSYTADQANNWYFFAAAIASSIATLGGGLTIFGL